MILYNQLSNKQEELIPLEKNKIRLYVCGITPYDTTHLGHAFTYIQFDVLVRFLTYKQYEVNYTQNITDIDDDILKRAAKEGKNWKELGDFWTEKFVTDMEALNALKPTHFAKATDSIPTIINVISKLLRDGYAYTSGGNIYFDVTKYKNYGQLSKLSEKEMEELSKERGADPNDPNKKHPLDFILWTEAKTNESSWEAPFGKGRPGWHIECSAMNLEYLGEQIDIHGGGKDLIFPHHESEIAQSESFTGKKPFSKFWMYSGMVEYQGDKMSKSLGNLVLVSDLLKNYSANAIRFMLLSNRYREPWEFETQLMNKAAEEVRKIEENLKEGEIPKEAIDLLSDDLNTPKALELLKQIPTTSLFELLGFK